MQHEIFGRNWPVGSAPGVTVVKKKKKNARCALMVKGTYFSKNNGGLI